MVEKNKPSAEELLVELIARKRERLLANPPLHKSKDPLSPEDYAKRLNEEIRNDSLLADHRREERIEEQLLLWGQKAGKRFKDAHITSPRVRKIVEARVERLSVGGPGHNNGLILTGAYGVGKTWTVYAFVKRLIEEGVMNVSEVMMGTEISMIKPLSDATFDRTEKVRDLLNPKYRFFYVDDVGIATFKSSKIRHELWYALIDHCYVKNLPLVITTNKSFVKHPVRDAETNAEYINEFEAWVGQASYDRLKALAGTDGLVVLDNKNMRDEANKRFDIFGSSRSNG